ncbi:YtxC-like family protein [compost metagenome]
MEMFTIIVLNSSEPYVSSLCSLILGELRHLHKDPNVFELRCDIQEPYTEIIGLAKLTEAEKRKMEDPIMESLSFALADHIMNEHEPAILRGLVQKELKQAEGNEIVQVEGYCKQFLYGDRETSLSFNETGSRRRTLIADQVHEHMQENSLLILDGFLRFRIQEYVEELREIVEYAMDEYLMDKQYQEFISLLKYFVYIQEAKIPTAHLIHKGGHEFIIMDDQLEPIDTNAIDSSLKLEVLDKDINFEDMIVSTLISVSPANIYIHTREPDMPIIHTIVQIFEDRTTICPYCRMCQAYLGEVKKQDQL